MGVDSVSPATSLALRAPPRPWTRPPSFGETAPGVNKLEQVTASRPPPAPRGNTHTPHSHQPSSLQRTVWRVGGGLESGGGTPRASSPRCGRLCPNPTVLGMCRKEPKAAGRETSRTRGPAHTTWHTSAAPATSGGLALCPGMLPGFEASGALRPGTSALRRILVGPRQVPRQGLLPARRPSPPSQ